jgi:hypothetical protein
MSNSYAFIGTLSLLLLAAAPQQDPQQATPQETRKERVEERRQELAGHRTGDGESGESEQEDESQGAKAYEGPYKSPYTLHFKYPIEQLLFDAKGQRGSVGEESSTPEREWYSEETRKRCGGWGVSPRAFDCPPEVREKPADWKRERVIAAASRFIGYEYQHHHVPDWNPPQGWPWNHCCAGKQGKGVDCSNFSGWNYNWALGIHLNTDIHKQGAEATAKGERGEMHAQVIKRPEGQPDQWYEELCRTLKPGDLLYIGDKSRDKVVHVIMWIGECADGPDHVPLIMDSTGGKTKDCEGHAIPCGIHLRPFAKGSWYHQRFMHAHRWIEG